MFGALDDFAPGEGDGRTTSEDYPDTDLGRALAEVARVIRGDVGVEVVTVDQGDWDMHSGMGTADGGWMTRQRPRPGRRRSPRSSATSATRRRR